MVTNYSVSGKSTLVYTLYNSYKQRQFFLPNYAPTIRHLIADKLPYFIKICQILPKFQQV